MTLCWRGCSVFSLTLVRGLVAILLIGGAALDSGTVGRHPCAILHVRGLAFNSGRWLACRLRLFHGWAERSETHQRPAIRRGAFRCAQPTLRSSMREVRR